MGLGESLAVREALPEGAVRYCGRLFRPEEIVAIRDLIEEQPRPSRAELSRLVCDLVGWVRPDGGRKDMACRVALLRMERDGLLTLPPPLRRNRNGRIRPRVTAASDPALPLQGEAGVLEPLGFEVVQGPRESALWNELIERYHYLGYKPLAGAQMRYLVYGGPSLVAVLGFGAAAWALGPRDRWIGWSPGQRLRNLHLVVNNARFLLLPWVRSPNLASRVLSGVGRRLPGDWEGRYGYRPVLLETFVEEGRFRGTSYRAANWIAVGRTQGRGKLDRHKRRALPVKEIFLYPLEKDFRRALCSPP